METCGEFEVVREFASGNDATLYVTRSAGRKDSANLALKRWHYAEEAQIALKGAAEQQAAVAAGCKRIAPIYDSGLTGDGCAYYVTNRYPIGLRQVIQARNKVTGEFLARLCGDVLRALAQLSQRYGRAHGNLRPGNILLDSGDPLAFHASLTDLAPDAGTASIADDLYDLGCIIYQVVRHSQRRMELHPPLEFGVEWESLGVEAAGWLAFCNRLLEKQKNREGDVIEELLRELGNIKGQRKGSAYPTEGGGTARAEPPRRKPILAIGLLVVALAALAGGYFAWQKRAASPQPEAPDPQLIRILPTLIDAARDVPDLQAILKRFRDDKTVVKNNTEFKAAVEQWGFEIQLEQGADWFRALGCTALEAEIGKARDLEPDGNFGAEVIAAEKAEKQSETIQTEWDKVTDVATSFRKSGVDSLARMADWPKQHLAEVKTLGDAVEFVQKLEGQMDDVSDFLEGDWKNHVNHLRFESESKFARPGEVNPEDWLQEVQNFEYVGPVQMTEWQHQIDVEKKALFSATSANSDQKSGVYDQLDKINRLVSGALKCDSPTIVQQLNTVDLAIQNLRATAAAPPAPLATMGANPPVPPGATPAPPRMDPDYQRFHDAVAALKNAVDAAQTLADVQAAQAGFQSDLANTPKYQADPTVKTLLDKLTAAAKAGPLTLPALAAKGWTATGKGDVDWVVYRYGNTGVDVPFHRVELQPGGDAFALSAIEMPVVIALSAGVPAHQPADGPLLWTLIENRPYATASYLWPSALEGLKALKQQYWDPPPAPPPQLLAPGLQAAPPPNGTGPVNFISLADARAMAQALGGDLPSLTLWKKAVDLAQGTDWMANPRLRGSAWKAQIDHLNDLANTATAHGSNGLDVGRGKRYLMPDLNSYAQGNETDDPVPGAADGQELWFSAVNRQSSTHPEGIYDLEGNVAEFVDDNGTPEIIGGSAVSSPAQPPTVPSNQVGAPGGYSDVGFRIAVPITGAGKDQVDALKTLVDTYLPPSPP